MLVERSTTSGSSTGRCIGAALVGAGEMRAPRIAMKRRKAPPAKMTSAASAHEHRGEKILHALSAYSAGRFLQQKPKRPKEMAQSSPDNPKNLFASGRPAPTLRLSPGEQGDLLPNRGAHRQSEQRPDTAFAEIGAGQGSGPDVSRPGAPPGTIAKSISAYDMAFSDAIYGKAPRFRLSKERLAQLMLGPRRVRPPDRTWLRRASGRQHHLLRLRRHGCDQELQGQQRGPRLDGNHASRASPALARRATSSCTCGCGTREPLSASSRPSASSASTSSTARSISATTPRSLHPSPWLAPASRRRPEWRSRHAPRSPGLPATSVDSPPDVAESWCSSALTNAVMVVGPNGEVLQPSGGSPATRRRFWSSAWQLPGLSA